MGSQVQCEHCRATYRHSPAIVGRSMTCSHCGQVMTIGTPFAVPPPVRTDSEPIDAAPTSDSDDDEPNDTGSLRRRYLGIALASILIGIGMMGAGTILILVPTVLDNRHPGSGPRNSQGSKSLTIESIPYTPTKSLEEILRDAPKSAPSVSPKKGS